MLAAVLALCGCTPVVASEPNVILIAVDDLNDWVSPLGGHPDALTPNLERLAAMGVSFTNAMAHVPACSPSRASVLTGAPAWKTGIYSNKQEWRDAKLPNGWRSIPGWFAGHGWRTTGAGKVSHGADRDLDPSDWTDGYFMPADYMTSYHDSGEYRSDWAIANTADGQFDFGPGDQGGRADIEVTDWAVDQIASGRANEGKSFTAVGIYRPHMPFVVPEEYFEMHSGEAAGSPPPGFVEGARTYVDNAADLADEPRRAVKAGVKSDGSRLDAFGEHEDFRRAYLAAITFADAQLGRILDAYEAGALGDNTYIVLFSDHGWQFGEKQKFRKFTLYERSLRVPFMVAGPGIKAGKTVKKSSACSTSARRSWRWRNCLRRNGARAATCPLPSEARARPRTAAPCRYGGTCRTRIPALPPATTRSAPRSCSRMSLTTAS